MYGRVISFTLLAPSLWSVVEAIGSKKNDDVIGNSLKVF